MRDLQALSGIPWAADLWWRYDANRGQAEGCAGLGQATKCQRHPVIPGLRQLLQTVRQELCKRSEPIDRFDQAESAVATGPIPTTSLLAVEAGVMHCASVVVSRPPTTIYSVTDASGSATGGILMQDQVNGLQPLAFLSRQLKPTEQRYLAYERELAAIAYCLQSCNHYLEGYLGGVTVVADHQKLTHYMDQPILSWVQTRSLRWGLFQSIRPTVKYQPKKANIVADALSQSQRLAAEETKEATAEKEEFCS